MSRAETIRFMTNCLLFLAAIAFVAAPGHCADSLERPNVLLVMTDDQGYGDLGVHGNTVIRTPHLDRLAGQSTRMEAFYVSPVCSPTRSSLMTGRYNYRTGVVDTYIGRSMMHADEVTLAEMLAAAGYQTGIFGKWHLGDNYPLRPQDQGFGHTLVHRGGGIGQPSDPPGNSYFDPWLLENGRDVQREGYCSDIFTDAAIEFIERNRHHSWFAYLPFNCPHTPLQVADDDVAPYRDIDFTAAEYGHSEGQPLPQKIDADSTARVYGMVTNIDENMGRLLARLDELQLADNTIVIFLTDNGPQQPRYNAGLLDRKGSVYEGGIRVPCFLRWPGHFAAGRTVEPIAAHIDLTPTLLAACGVAPPAQHKFDGVNLLPLLEGETNESPAFDRALFFQWHRGDVPQPRRACAVRTQQYKLVQPQGVPEGAFDETSRFELYDLSTDRFEQRDIAAEHPEVVSELVRLYDGWYEEMKGERNFAPPRIALGTPHENPTILTRQDWRGDRAGWDAKNSGHWLVEVRDAGRYDITLRFPAPGDKATAHFQLAGVEREAPIAQDATAHTFHDVQLPTGPGQLKAWIATPDNQDGRGVHYVDVQRVD